MLEEPFLISAVTLRELEDIKVSRNKDDDVKFRARRILHILDEHPDIYAMADITTATYNALAERKMPDTPDNLICVSAAYIKSTSHPDLEFVTNDSGVQDDCKICFSDCQYQCRERFRMIIRLSRTCLF